MKEKDGVTELQRQMVDVSDNIVFAQYFTVAGLMISPACLLGGTWVWYVAAAFLLVVSLLSSIQWWRLWQRKGVASARD